MADQDGQTQDNGVKQDAELPVPTVATTQPNAPGAATEGFNATAAAMTFADPAEAPIDWSPAPVDDNGFALDGHGLPINLRLRAAALADGGHDEDPVGMVPVETIDAERERLAEFDERYPALHANSKVADVEAAAKAEGVDISSATNNEQRVAMIVAARPSRV